MPTNPRTGFHLLRLTDELAHPSADQRCILSADSGAPHALGYQGRCAPHGKHHHWCLWVSSWLSPRHHADKNLKQSRAWFQTCPNHKPSETKIKSFTGYFGHLWTQRPMFAHHRSLGSPWRFPRQRPAVSLFRYSRRIRRTLPPACLWSPSAFQLRKNFDRESLPHTDRRVAPPHCHVTWDHRRTSALQDHSETDSQRVSEKSFKSFNAVYMLREHGASKEVDTCIFCIIGKQIVETYTNMVSTKSWPPNSQTTSIWRWETLSVANCFEFASWRSCKCLTRRHAGGRPAGSPYKSRSPT